MDPSCTSQVLPGPSGPVGQRILDTLENWGQGLLGKASIWIPAPVRAIRTREDKKGVAPMENGMPGLLVFSGVVALGLD